MNLFFFKKAKPSLVVQAIPATEFVEDIVARLKNTPPASARCFVELKYDGALPETNWGPGGEDDIFCFTQRSLADEIGSARRILALGNMAELWAFFVNPVRGTMIRPNGLRINYNYDAASYLRYPAAEIKRIGLEGLTQGFRAGGRLKNGQPVRVQVPLCMVCHKPSLGGIQFTCYSCGFSSELHENCRPGANLFGRNVATFGGGSLSCPRCGARGF